MSSGWAEPSCCDRRREDPQARGRAEGAPRCMQRNQPSLDDDVRTRLKASLDAHGHALVFSPRRSLRGIVVAGVRPPSFDSTWPLAIRERMEASATSWRRWWRGCARTRCATRLVESWPGARPRRGARPLVEAAAALHGFAGAIVRGSWTVSAVAVAGVDTATSARAAQERSAACWTVAGCGLWDLYDYPSRRATGGRGRRSRSRSVGDGHLGAPDSCSGRREEPPVAGATSRCRGDRRRQGGGDRGAAPRARMRPSAGVVGRRPSSETGRRSTGRSIEVARAHRNPRPAVGTSTSTTSGGRHRDRPRSRAIRSSSRSRRGPGDDAPRRPR